MATKSGYSVVVIEVNEIAGEQVSCKVAVYTSKTFGRCVDWCEKKWGGAVPRETMIRDNQSGNEFRPHVTWPFGF